jgi:hypothetical protein
MPQYMVAVYRPDDYDPSLETDATIEAIHALNRELTAAGARKFACGLSSAGNAKSLRAQPDGNVLVTDGPYIETKEHIGGFWILEAADINEALAWARKGAVACRASGEVREILFRPALTQGPGESM